MPQRVVKPVIERWCLAVLVILLGFQIVLYAESFVVGPAGDDFNAPLADIWRGESEGPLALLTSSAQPNNYRPLQSLLMWAFGKGPDESRLLRIHLLAFTGMLVFAFAACLWISAIPASKLAKFGGLLVVFVHPALVAPLAGIDGFSTLFSTGLMWISVFIIWRFGRYTKIGITAAMVVFVLALGFKEYALGAVPLACLAVLCFGSKTHQTIGRCVQVGAALSIVVCVFILLRQFTIPQPADGQEVAYLRIDPILWMKNAAMLGGALLFPGNTRWLFLSDTTLAWILATISICVIGLTLTAGLWQQWMPKTHSISTAGSEKRRWMVFAACGIVAASFPAVLVFHVSEMYVAGMILPLALVVTMAIDGIRTFQRVTCSILSGVLMVSMGWSVLSVRAKVSDLRRMGDLAESMLRQVLAYVPEGARDIEIAVCYPLESLTEPTYSVFEMRPPLLIEQPQSLWWLRPYHGLTIAVPNPSLEQALASSERYGLILLWDEDKRCMSLVHSNLSDSD